MIKKIIVMMVVLLVCLTGCKNASEKKQADTVVKDHVKEMPARFMITSINYFDYQKALECSGYASAYVLRHFREKADGVDIYNHIPDKFKDGGVAPTSIEKYFKQIGYDAKFKTDGTVERLKEELSKGVPIIVFIHVVEPYTTTHNTHYVPLVGYDEEYFYFAESLSDYANYKDQKNLPYNRKTKISKFEKLWSNTDGIWNHPYFVITQ